MVNTELLNEEIKKSGKKKNHLAMKCGLTRAGLRLKILNRHPFTADEVQALCDELNIESLERKEAIFFAREVE